MENIEDLYTLYNTQCQTIGTATYNTEEERKLACTEKNKKGSNSGDSEVFYDYNNNLEILRISNLFGTDLKDFGFFFFLLLLHQNQFHM